VPVFANRYEYFEVLGTGGWGVVRRAHDRHLDREVALKTYPAGADLLVATWEAQRLMALEGPHILRVFNADKYQDVPYITTEIAPLKSAQDRAGGYGVRPDLAVRWVRHGLIGLGVCHQARLIHRDIKASNIFLDSEDLAKLGDFGVAAVMNTAGTTQPHGAWSIRAPEAYAVGVVSVRSDVYSMGLTLYQLLTGTNPFERATVPETEAAVLAHNYPRVRDIAPQVPRVLAMRVDKAMALDPGDRYASAAEFNEDLGAIRRLSALFAPRIPHPGHLQCWEGTSLGRGIRVCVEQAAGPFSIDVRRTEGAQTRIRDLCGVVPSVDRLRIHLRRVFDEL
jgi:eukaryotic-like serine/threonine-protein kinase